MAGDDGEMISIEKENSKYLLIIAEGSEKDIRTTLSLSHDDGLELLSQLCEYYNENPTVEVPLLQEYIEFKRVQESARRDNGKRGEE